MKTLRRRRWLIAIGVVILVFGTCYLFRTSILSSLGQFLTIESSDQPTPYLVILGGNSFERGSAAIQWVNEGRVDQLVCTGGNVPSALLALDTVLTEAQLTKRFLIARGVGADGITLLENNTSTFEEAEALKAWCLSNKVEHCTVLSSTFHLRRVRKVFRQVFDETDIQIDFASAPPLNYDVERWWESEEGLIMVNNEYMKHLYYWWKY